MKKLLIILIFVIFLVGCSYQDGKLSIDFSKIKQLTNETNNISEKTTTKIKKPFGSCEKKASELMPKYLVISSNRHTQIENRFADGQTFTFIADPNYRAALYSCIRKGSNEGENINYYYLREGSNEPDIMLGETYTTCTSKISYSKQMIDENGKILGTRSFSFSPTFLKLADINLNITLKSGEKGGFNGLDWSGFTDEVKKILNVEKIIFRIEEETLRVGGGKISEELYDQEKGEANFGEDKAFKETGSKLYLSSVFVKEHFYGNYYTEKIATYNLKISPDILTNKIYEIGDYKINDCNWVE